MTLMGAQERDSTHSLEAYLPLDRRRALARGENLPERQAGTALFADVSGFTPLMEHLALTLGPQRGAEELTHILNRLFTPLVGEVHRHGGSIVAFGGDALTCWFAGEPAQAALQAAACGQALQRHVAHFERLETPAGPVTLSMHVGIGSGQARRFRVGRPPHGLLDVLAGSVLERMGKAQALASTGQVVVDERTAAHLPAPALSSLATGFFLLGSSPLPVPLSVQDKQLPPLPADRILQWVAAPLIRRVQASAGEFAAELRLVTSLFVQFAGLDYDGDPEVGDKLRAYVALAQEQLARYEGYLALVACGDKGSILHIFFGAPISHEDDPNRAVTFALGFQRAVGKLPFIHEQRIGLSLGRVYAGVLGSPRRCTYTVLGDEVNVSARLMQAAAANQILVSRRVQQAAVAHYAFHHLGSVEAKGKEKTIPVFEPLRPQERRPLVENRERLVGREEEKRAIAGLLDEVESNKGHVLQIVGEAGVGKSALVRELLRRAQERGWRTHVGICLSYGQHTPYLPWRTVLEEVCRLTPEMESGQRTAHLKEAVDELPDPPGRPGYWRARFPLLAEAMGLDAPETALTRSLEGELRRDNTFQILEALVRRLAAQRPTAVVLEDAYWADELSLALVAHIGRSLGDSPLLLVLVRRPFTAAAPLVDRALQTIPHQVTISLRPLVGHSADELARERLQATTLPPPLETLLREKAQGNPFFIEELLRALQEAGYLERRESGVELTGAWEQVELPDTIEGVVRARLDRLAESNRLTLKVASVIGRTFRRPLLQQVHPARPAEPTLARQLSSLGRAEFTQLEEGPPEWRYIFRHPILHEVTYETMLFAQRRKLHGAIGFALESRYGDDIQQGLDLLAYHFARSEEREKGIHYLQLAGDKARREYANQVALDHYSRALELVRPEEREHRYDLLAGRERIYNLLGDRAAQERDLEEMALIAGELSDGWRQAKVLNRKARLAVDTGAFHEAQSFAHQARERAEAENDLAAAAEAQKILGIAHAVLGEYEEAIRFFSQARETYQTLHDRPGETSCLGNLGLVHLYRGDAEQARVYHSRALELVRALENRWQETRVLINLGVTNLHLGEYERALERYRQALRIAREIGSTADEELTLNNIGFLAMSLGDYDEALVHYQQALKLARQLEDQEGEAMGLSNLGLLLAYRGKLKQARRFLGEARERYRSMGHRRGEATALHDLGVVELGAGEGETAKALFRQALEMREAIGEAGNSLVTTAWLGLAHLVTGEVEQARALLEKGLARLEAEGYGGDSPEHEIWWLAYRVWQGSGEGAQAHQALCQAHDLLQQQAQRIRDPALRTSLLENVPVNREIMRAWAAADHQERNRSGR